MCLAEGDARNAACDQAGIDRSEAREERIVPALSIRPGLGIDVLAGPGEDIIEAVLPVIDIFVVDGTTLGRLLTGHCR